MGRIRKLDEKAVKQYIAEHGLQAARAHFRTSYNKLYTIIGDTALRRPYQDAHTLRRDLKKFEYNIPLLAKYYAVHYGTVYGWMQRHGIKAPKTPWTKADDLYLRNNIFDKSNSDIAKYLGRSVLAVQNRAHELRLTFKRMLGYLTRDVMYEWGVTQSWLGSAREKFGLPHTKHSSKHVSYDPIALWEWLEAGNVLRLEYDKIHPRFFDLRQLHKDAQRIFVSRAELAEMGFPRESNPCRYLLNKIPHLYMHPEFGYIYRRADIKEHFIAYRWAGNYRATPDQWWYQEIIDECAERFVTTAAFQYSINVTKDICIRHPLKPRQFYRGLYPRADVLRYLQHRRLDSVEALQRLAEYEETELRCASNR